jgi:hypothetical protein
MADTGTFKPKKLSATSLEAPMQRRWDVMGADEAKRLHAKAQTEAQRFSWTGPRTKKRLLRYLVLTPLGFALLGWFFVGTDLRTFAAFLLVGLPVGGLMMVIRPADYLAGLIYAICGLVAIVWTGRVGLMSLAFGTLLIGSIGMIVGRGEEMRRMDLED